jgi:GST-like protein
MMIELYTANTPNGIKASIMLEEVELPYEVTKIDLRGGEQRSPSFLKLNPNGKIPVIVDRDTGLRVFESGAILIYLAEKSGRLMPSDAPTRTAVLEWLFFQMGNVGPMLGQLWHFVELDHQIPYALERYRKETLRLYGVAEGRLGETRYLAGDSYTIADIANWPWLRVHQALNIDIEGFPKVKRWLIDVAARPAVKKGITIPG